MHDHVAVAADNVSVRVQATARLGLLLGRRVPDRGPDILPAATEVRSVSAAEAVGCRGHFLTRGLLFTREVSLHFWRMAASFLLHEFECSDVAGWSLRPGDSPLVGGRAAVGAGAAVVDRGASGFERLGLGRPA